jgi:hypothetical protein
MIRILKGANFTPEEVTLRRKIEHLKGELSAATTQKRVEVLVKTINELVRQLNTLGTNAINIAVTGVSLEEEKQKLQERLSNGRAAQSAPPSPGTPGEASGISDCPRAGRGEGLPPRPATPAPSAPPPLRPQYRPPPIPVRECRTERCKTRNPASARFCRRCGKVLAV